MEIKIIVAHHKEYYTRKSNIMMPIHVGKKKSSRSFGFQGDDQGLNISDKNNIYCELTASYWGWKNLTDIDYLGICHYRRYFTFERLSCISLFKNMLKSINSKTSSKNEIHIFDYAIADKKLSKFEEKLKNDINKNNIEIYALYPAKIEGKNVREFFFKPAGYFPIELLEKIIINDFPDYSIDFNKVISGKKIYYGNMVLMKKKLFDEYANFIFDVLNKHEIESKASNWCFSTIDEGCYFRLSGYLGELLTSCFVEKSLREGRKVRLLNSYFLDLK
jgi:hypothetical protein